jgi:hypothetical protein
LSKQVRKGHYAHTLQYTLRTESFGQGDSPLNLFTFPDDLKSRGSGALVAVAPLYAYTARSIKHEGGSLEGLNIEKCRVLQNRQVMLCPDVNAYAKWKKKAFELRRVLPGTTFAVSNELERMATQHDQKTSTDLGDVLV